MGSCDQARLLVVSSILLTSSAKPNLRCHSLCNHGVDREVNAMFDVGAETLALPLSEKMKFEQGDSGDSFG